MRRLPRGVKKNDPRIYQPARNHNEAAAKVVACGGGQSRLDSLLSRAAYENDLLTAREALKSGADPNSQNLLGEGPMKSLCWKGNAEMLRLFLEHGASLGRDKFGVPPLIHAIHRWREDLVMEMIQAGADVNVRENDTLQTALHHAVTGRHSLSIVKMLLAAGADPRQVDRGGNTVLEWARIRNERFGGVRPAVFRLLQKAMEEWKSKPPPKKPRRRPQTKLAQLARKYVDDEAGEVHR